MRLGLLAAVAELGGKKISVRNFSTPKQSLLLAM